MQKDRLAPVRKLELKGAEDRRSVSEGNCSVQEASCLEWRK
jgi:hypothetical protein